jgi:hypothetical protein
VSNQPRNNRGQPIEVRVGGEGTMRAGKFQGHAKVRRPEHGGGSVSNQPRNNRGQPIEVRVGGDGTMRAGKFQGHAKVRRPQKGGGSVSGKLWNNKNEPIDVNTAGKGTVDAAAFKGRTKYQKPPHTAGKPAKYSGNTVSYAPENEFSRVGLNYTGDYKQQRNKYVQNPNAAKASLKKDRQPDGLRLNVPFLNQGKRSVNAGHYNHVVKQYWDYKKNPDSHKDALKIHQSAKAQANIGNVQSNVRMKKYSGSEMHPDSKFAQSLRDNVKSERTFLMNVKLTWAKIFKKEANQPHNLKEKPKKPRYNPNEVGLWYE